MTLTELKTRKPGDKVAVINVARDEVEVTILNIEKNLVTVDTTGTVLDSFRSQVDIEAGNHRLQLFAKFLA